MGTINIPALIIQGDAGAGIPAEISGKRVVQLMSQSRLLVYKNAPRGLYFTHRRQMIKDLKIFLKEKIAITPPVNQ